MSSPRSFLLRSLTLVFGLLGAVRAAESEIELRGSIAAEGRPKVMLASTTSGDARWVTVGDTFAGYVVSSYDAATETVVLTKDGATLRVKMKVAKVVAGPIEPPAQVQRLILNQLRQLCAAADQFYFETGRKTTTYDQIVGEDKYVRKTESQAGENYRAIVFEQGKPLEVTTASGFKMSYGP